MSLSRKHYQAVADVIADEADAFGTEEAAVEAIACIADGLALFFAADNPNFDRGRFLAACNVEAT